MIYKAFHAIFFCFTLLGLFLSSCALSKSIPDERSQSFLPLKAEQVVFFESISDISKEFEYQFVEKLSSTFANSYGSIEPFLNDLRKLAGEKGANVVVLKTLSKGAFVFWDRYDGTAEAYRIFEKDPLTPVDGRTIPGHRLTPPMPNKTPILTYPSIKAY